MRFEVVERDKLRILPGRSQAGSVPELEAEPPGALPVAGAVGREWKRGEIVRRADRVAGARGQSQRQRSAGRPHSARERTQRNPGRIAGVPAGIGFPAFDVASAAPPAMNRYLFKLKV